MNKPNRDTVSNGTFQGTPIQAGFTIVVAAVAIPLAIYLHP